MMSLDLSKKLSSILSEKMKGVSGAAAFAVWQKRDILASCAVGAEPSDLFCLGSVSKIYCAAAIMVLVDRGLVDLDTPVCNYLPRFHMADERYKKITVRMALNHSSGLPGTCIRYGFTRETIPQERLEDCFYDYFAHSKLKAEPGTISVYCNDGFTLAELIVKEVSGLTLAEFVRENILSKIGATRTCYTHEKAPGRIVTMGTSREIINLAGAGGVAADMADVCRFGALFLPGHDFGVLSSASCEEMRRMQGRSVIDDPAALCYGLGWDTVQATAAPVHFGPNLMGVHAAGTLYDYGEGALSKAGTSTQVKSLLVVLPKYDAVCAMAVTLDTGLSRDELLPELLAAALEEKGISIRKENTPTDIRTCPADRSFSGYYLSGPMLLECRVEDCSAAVYACVGEMRIPIIEEVLHSGKGVFCAEGFEMCRFVHGEDRNYLHVLMENSGLLVIAESIPPLPEISEPWRRRIGSTWICVNGDSVDAAIEDNGAFAWIDAVSDVDNLLTCTVYSPDAHGFSAVPFCCGDDRRGCMFMNGPSMSSRDSGEPIIDIIDGYEELYFSGMRYRRLEDLSQIKPGSYVTDGKSALAFLLPEDQDVSVASDSGQVFLYDRQHNRTEQPAHGGLALLMGDSGSRFSVCFSPKT